jgi:molecular chaperone Hsp33
MSRSVENGVSVRSSYIRHRNVLAIDAELSPLFVDYYLHLNDIHLRPDPEIDRMEKDLLAALLLYACSRPWNEQFAWTLNIADPSVNLFAAVDNDPGHVIGTVFQEGVRETERSQFFAESVRGNEERHRSVVEFDSVSILRACETLFMQSEQRHVRLFEFKEERYLMLGAQPDCEIDWLKQLRPDEAEEVLETEECSLLEERRYVWSCGCGHDRLVQLTAAATRSDPSEIFGEDHTVAVTCPRCGRRYRITREMVEAYRSGDL